MSKKYIIIDVTTLLKWSRQPVGIIRTQLEFVDYLLQNDETALYCKFNQNRDHIELVTTDVITKVVKNLKNYKQGSQTNSTQSDSIKKRYSSIAFINKIANYYKENGLKELLIKICQLKCNEKVKNFAKIVYFKFFRNSSHDTASKNVVLGNLDTILYSSEIHTAAQSNYDFLNKNAIFVSMGLDWDNSNYPLLYLLKQKYNFEFVGSFYDGIPIINPELVQSAYFSQMFFSHFYNLIYLSNRIFCISDFSKNQMVQICEKHHINTIPLLQTIHLGVSVHETNTKTNYLKRKHNQNYVLYVSTIESRKNHILLLKVWQKLQKEKFKDLPDLVLVGMMGWGVDEMTKLYSEDKELQKIVHFYDDVDDEELVQIYNDTKFTLFPSFIEGWGLGAVESFLYGKPCIISNCDALIEATQGLAPSLSPTDIDAWCKMVKEFSSNEKILAINKTKIENEFKPKTWKEFSIDFEKFIKAEK